MPARTDHEAVDKRPVADLKLCHREVARKIDRVDPQCPKAPRQTRDIIACDRVTAKIMRDAVDFREPSPVIEVDLPSAAIKRRNRVLDPGGKLDAEISRRQRKRNKPLWVPRRGRPFALAIVRLEIVGKFFLRANGRRFRGCAIEQPRYLPADRTNEVAHSRVGILAFEFRELFVKGKHIEVSLAQPCIWPGEQRAPFCFPVFRPMIQTRFEYPISDGDGDIGISG